MCTSLDDLLLSEWIKCSVDKDFSVLVRSGVATPAQIQDCWIALISKYQVLIDSKDAKKYVDISAKIERLNVKIYQVESLIITLRIGYYPELIECLQIWGYDLPFTAESIEKDLIRVSAKLGRDKTEIEMTRREYADQQESKTDGTATREYYDEMLVILSRHDKVNPMYRANKITTSEFAIMCKQYQAYVRAVNRETNKGSYAE